MAAVGGGIVLCRNKALLDREAAVKRLNNSMRKSISRTFREKPYEKVPRRIIAEQLIEEHDGVGNITNNILPDYKFFCFNGEPQYCQVIRNRNSKETIDFYDMQWCHMPFIGLNPNATNGVVAVEQPKNLQQLKAICRELSKGLKFVRIDLYVVNDKEYFGEITFYPNSGFGKFAPNEWDKKLGDILKLEGVKLGGGVKVLLSEKHKIKVMQTPQHDLYDYKFFCFNGKCRCFKVDFGRFKNHHANYFIPNGEMLPFGEKGLEPDPSYKIALPDDLSKMIVIAEKLAIGFCFIRVDLYNVNGKIYFGELTFYPASGLGRFTDDKWDENLGEWLKLPIDK